MVNAVEILKRVLHPGLSDFLIYGREIALNAVSAAKIWLLKVTFIFNSFF